ncbi:hypothetical protein SteCoe_2158 [Stentor coeruleus]|uniref:Uncharacterized protein n=1 Tax=Stentor coeruleus TaxID=5963 RepID=A0A1R2D0B4_9CILI|nr:hypothetical protein SteCoe_2158 [Stentor coeruleus]
MSLNFTSWWWENNEKQDIIISLTTNSKSLIVTIKDLDPITVDTPSTATGKDADIWDMFVGSELDILGKYTILKSCDPSTAVWNEAQGTRLLKIRDKLAEEIRKYENKQFPQRLLVKYHTNIPGGYNLRAIINQIGEFHSILAKYRPALANGIIGDSFPY